MTPETLAGLPWAAALRPHDGPLAADSDYDGGCVAAGVTLDAAGLRRVTFRNCKLDGVNLRAATLAEVSFTDCLLRDVDFGGATLRRCTFRGSQLREADFSRVTLEQVDLRGAGLGLIITPGALRGATISSGQLAELAPVLAEQAGIEVADLG